MADTETSTGTAAPVNQQEVVANLFGALRLAETAPEPVTDAPVEEAQEPEVPETASEPTTEVAETPAETAAKMKFLIDNEEVDEDTLVEWKKNGLRQKDYTQKTQALSETQKKLQAERAQEREQTLAHWQKLQQAVEALVPKEPDWSALQAQVRNGTLPQADYERFAAQWLSDKQQRDLIAAETAKAEAAVQADRQAQADALAKANADRVMELVPEFKDEGKRREVWGEMVAYAKTIEPTISEADLLGNHPAFFKVLHDAMAYHKLQAQAQTPPKVKLVTPLKPGGANPAPKTNPMKQALGRLQQSGKVDDGAALFRAYRELGGS